MDIISSQEMQNELASTGQEVEDTMPVLGQDGQESTKEFEWKDASAGHLNPMLASGFADVFDAHVDTFARLDGLDHGTVDEKFENDYSDGQLKLSIGAREAFAEIIAGDQDAAAQMFSSTVEYNENSMEEYMSTFDGDPDPVLPQRAGNLWEIVDSGITSEADRRLENHNNQVDEENARNEFIVGLGTSYIAHPQAAEAVSYIGGEFLQEHHIEEDNREQSDTRAGWLREQARLNAINGLSGRDEGYDELIGSHLASPSGGD